LTKVSYHDRGEGRLQIRIIGKWLQEYFSKGDYISIKVINGDEIILSKFKVPERLLERSIESQSKQ